MEFHLIDEISHKTENRFFFYLTDSSRIAISFNRFRVVLCFFLFVPEDRDPASVPGLDHLGIGKALWPKLEIRSVRPILKAGSTGNLLIKKKLLILIQLIYATSFLQNESAKRN